MIKRLWVATFFQSRKQYSSESRDPQIFISTLLWALKECTSSRDIVRGKALHAAAIQELGNCSNNIYIANMLIKMYSNCGNTSESRRVFDSIPIPTIVSWNALLLAYGQNGEEQLALEVFEMLMDSPTTVNAASFVAVLKTCTALAGKETGVHKKMKLKSLKKGMKIHAQALTSGLDSHAFVSNTLVDFYAKCGDLADARSVFDKMASHDVVSWTALLLGYVDNGEGNLALELFFLMQKEEGCEPNALSFVAAVKACTSFAAQPGCIHHRMDYVSKGLQIQCLAEDFGFQSDVVLANAFVDMFGKFGRMLDAQRVFDGIQKKTVVSWTSLMMGYAENGEEGLALEIFSRMQSEDRNLPNALSFVSALKACSGLAVKEVGERDEITGKSVKAKSLKKARSLHAQAAGRDEFDRRDSFVGNSLVDLYGKCGSVSEAWIVFSRMKVRDVVSYNALMAGYVENGESVEALRIFACMCCEPNNLSFVAALKACISLASEEEATQMIKVASLEKGMEVHSRAVAAAAAAASGSGSGDLDHNRNCDLEFMVGNTVVDMYVKCGSLWDARRAFDCMKFHSVVPWTSLLLGYAESGDRELAFAFLSCTRLQGFPTDAQTLAAALKLCGRFVSLEACKELHAEILTSGLENDAVLRQSLVDVYGRCSSMVSAQQVFDGICGRDSLSWTALIAGYSRGGEFGKVLELFRGMQEEGLRVDEITLLCVLSSCSHAGLVSKGEDFFAAMKVKFGLTPAIEHYCCMVDILGRANELDRAVKVVKSAAERGGRANIEGMWRTLLGACVKWKNVVVGRMAFEALIEVAKGGEREDVAYTLMANLYGSLGMWEEKAKVEALRFKSTS